jgi:hypothetical protein
MKMVFTVDEVAEALQKSVSEFGELRPMLEDLGFPKPLHGLEDRWSILDVINWVNGANKTSHVGEANHLYGNGRIRYS